MEFLGRETVEVCRGCGEVLPRSYWRADGDVVCERCAEERRERDRAEARGCLERGLVFGWIAAVAGAFGQAGAWGLIAQMDVGEDAWILRAYLQVSVAMLAAVLVAIAVRVGSRRRGGWAIQVMALGLTVLLFEGSFALWTSGSVGAVALRRLVGSWMGGGLAGVPPVVDMVFGMGLAWWVNREGRRAAISGPFGYAGRGPSSLPRRMSH